MQQSQSTEYNNTDIVVLDKQWANLLFSCVSSVQLFFLKKEGRRIKQIPGDRVISKKIFEKCFVTVT